MPESDDLIAWDFAHLWHPFTCHDDWISRAPLVIERAEGNYLIDRDGVRYLDGVSSLWCNVHGHRHARLDAALRAQADRVAHSTLLGLTHEPAIRLARRLVEIAPPGLTRVFFSDNGATAVEVALKMAFQYWRQKQPAEPARAKFIALDGAYHGDTIGDVSLGGVARFHAMFRPLLFETLRAAMPHCDRCPLGLARPGCAIACLREVERHLVQNPGRVAAIVVEPIVQCAAGMIVHPEGFLRGLRTLADQYDTLLIADEVAVGFGRTGTMFACEHEAVTPDFLCLAKGITAGYLPLAATLTTERVHDAFRGAPEDGTTFFHGHTYGGNPLAAAVALANLDVFEQENTIAAIRPKSKYLVTRLAEIATLPHVGNVRQAGLIAGVELVSDRDTKQPFPASARIGQHVCMAARGKGVLLRPLGDLIVIMPPLSVTMDELRILCDAIASSIQEVVVAWELNRRD